MQPLVFYALHLPLATLVSRHFYWNLDKKSFLGDESLDSVSLMLRTCCSDLDCLNGKKIEY